METVWHVGGNVNQHLSTLAPAAQHGLLVFSRQARMMEIHEFALHVSAICKAILAPAVSFIIGAPWNAFELCLLEPIQSWCNCVHIDAYRHRDLSTCSFGSWAHKDASALHSQQQDLQLTGCTKFRVYFHRIPYAMHHYALTLWIEHFSLWNPVFPLFCDLNPLQRSIFHDTIYWRSSLLQKVRILLDQLPHLHWPLIGPTLVPGSTGPSSCTSFHHFINGFKLRFEGSWKQKGS